MGNSYGRFSEELPTEADAAGNPEPYEKPVPQAVPAEGSVPSSTMPVDKLSDDELKKKAE